MQEKAKEPEIRFAGFTGAWEQRKLSDLCSMHARIGWQNLRTSEFLDQGQYLLITGTDFGNGSIRFNSCHFVKKERYDQDKNIQVKNGSILITKDGTLGKVAYVENLNKPATLNAGVFNVKTKGNDVDNKYLFQYLKAPFLMKYVDEKSTGGTIKHLNQSILVNFPVVLPGVEEQRKIGEFLSHIDSILTLHQRKYEKLLNIKKSMLEKMFPKEGEVVPEIRFKGFTGAWEQRKFGEMANRRSEVSASGNLPRVEYEDIVSGTGTLNKDVFEKQSQKQGIVFHSGDVLYGKLRPYLQNWLLASFNGLAVGDFWVLEPQGLNSNYLYRIIQTKQFDEIANQSVGTKMPRADWKLVSKATFLNPASFNEQRLIGKFFKDIDSLLTLHQRKLEMLKNVKQAFLEKMFV